MTQKLFQNSRKVCQQFLQTIFRKVCSTHFRLEAPVSGEKKADSGWKKVWGTHGVDMSTHVKTAYISVRIQLVVNISV